MKVMLKADTTDKMKVLDNALMSVECKVKGENTYLWYYEKEYAEEDKESLEQVGIQSVILNGWEHDGFVTW